MINIQLKYNCGFAWFRKEACWAKGYLMSSKGILYENEAVADYFEGITGLEDFTNRLSDADGCFSILIEFKGNLFAACDKTRIFPLFYAREKDAFYISDDPDILIRNTLFNTINALSAAEFSGSGYVTGEDTLIQGIYQVQPGTALYYNGRDILKKNYFNYYTSTESRESPDLLASEMESIIVASFTKILGKFRDRPVVIPLSGGYDSRLIAVMAKNAGLTNVTCYTYGRKGNRDVPLSRKVAEKLGFAWHCIPTLESITENYLEDTAFQSYYPFASRYTSMFYMQDYFAVQYLHNNHLIPAGSVFMPGHGGDFLGGSQYIKMFDHTLTLDNLAEQIFKKKFYLNKPGGQHAKKIITKIEVQLNLPLHRDLNTLPWTLHGDWEAHERFPKFIINSSQQYLQLGYKVCFPFWNNTLIQFFSTLPFEQKTGKQLYNKVLEERFFEPAGIHFKHEIEPSLMDIRLQHLKIKIRKLLPLPLRKYLARRRDWMCYHEITREMLRDMQHRGGEYQLNTESYNSVIVQWYLALVQ